MLRSPEAKERARLKQREVRTTPEYRARAAARMREYRAKNAETLKEQSRARYAADPEKVREKNAAWRRANPEKVRAMEAAYVRDPRAKRAAGAATYDRHKERYAATRAEWRKNNRDKVVQYTQKHRASKVGEVRDVDWVAVLRRHASSCAYCGKRGRMEMDHVIPLSRGGRHSIGNVLPACRSCNAEKGAKLLMEWRLTRA